MSDKPTIGIIGGTGSLGSGLAKGWAAAGYPIVIGSRMRDKAVSAAAGLCVGIRGDDNIGAARAADIVVIVVPYASHDETIIGIGQALQGKIVVDAVVPPCRLRSRLFSCRTATRLP